MKKLVAFLIVVSLVFGSVNFTEGKGGSSGGRSSFGGSRSSYSSGSRSSGGSHSYSGSKSSSGSKSGSSYSGSSKSSSSPAAKSPSGSSYSGSKSSSSPAAKSPSGSSYSGSKSSSSPAAKSPSGSSYSSTGSPAPTKSPSGSSYSSGKASSPAPSDSKYSTSKKPTGTSVTSEMGKAAKVEQSTNAVKRAEVPKASYTTPVGKEVKIDPKSKQVEHARTVVTDERYATRNVRINNFYGGYGYYGRPVTYYGDSWNPWFYLWLFDHCSVNDRYLWAYNHRSEIDDARWRDMCQRDANLEVRVRQLEAEKAAKDPNYVPPQMKDNPDLMYSDEYVNAVVNPQEESSGVWTFFVWTFWILVAIGVGYLAYWIVFVKRWNT